MNFIRLTTERGASILINLSEVRSIVQSEAGRGSRVNFAQVGHVYVTETLDDVANIITSLGAGRFSNTHPA